MPKAWQNRLKQEWAVADQAGRERLLAVYQDEIDKLSPRQRETLTEKLSET
jgi:hypothetical protein